MAECERYADSVEKQQAEEKRARNPLRGMFTGRKVKYMLNAREKAFFQNISMEFFSPSKRYIEEIIKEADHSKAMRGAGKVLALQLYNWGARWADKVKGFFATFFKSKFDAILNTVILIESLMLYSHIKNRAQEAWDNIKTTITENPVYQRIISPAIDYITDAGEPLFEAFGKAWDDLIDLWGSITTPESPLGKIMDFISKGVDYVFSEVFDPGNIWSLYLEMIKIAGLSYLYGLMGLFGFKPDTTVDVKFLTPSAEG